MRLKSDLSIALLIASFSTINVAYAYQNEPDGFRGVTWGTEYSTLSGFSPDGRYAGVLEVFARKGGPRFLTFPMVSYRRVDEKLEFADVPVSSVSYSFFNDKLVQVELSFFDGTDTPQGKLYTANGRGKEPEGYFRKNRFDNALYKYFGKPTESPGLLGVLSGNNEISYDGEVTQITSKCEGPTKSRCKVIFESKKARQEVLATWQALIENRVAEISAAREAEEKAKAAVKAKPDF